VGQLSTRFDGCAIDWVWSPVAGRLASVSTVLANAATRAEV
jgi:hypothetical protein